MGNARPVLKQSSDWIVSSNRDPIPGVCVALEAIVTEHARHSSENLYGWTELGRMVVEVSRDSCIRYEYDEAVGAVLLNVKKSSKVIKYGETAGPVPFNYGFFPGTFCGADLEVGLVESPVPGDLAPLDVFVVQADPCAPGETIDCEVWGALRVLDKGQADWKIIAYPIAGDPPSDTDIHRLKRWLDGYYS